MAESEQIQKLKTFNYLFAIYNRDVSEDAAEFMLEAVEDISAEAFKKAAKHFARTSKFMPSIAEIREYVEINDPNFNPVGRRSKPMTQRSWYEHCERMDQSDMGMTDEEFEQYKKHYEEEHGGPYVPPGYEEHLNAKEKV